MTKYLVVLLIALLLFTGVAMGYEVVEVKNGATIKGVVSFKGTLPADETIAIDRDVEVCGKEQKLNKYIITDSKIKNAVVFIDRPKKGKPLSVDTPVDLTIKNCKVEPLVSVGFVGGRFRFKNDDSILHTLQLKLWLEYQRRVSDRPLKDGATIYNIAFPRKGRVIEKPIKRSHRYQPDTGSIRVTSNTHPWMRGYVFAFDHPYAAVTDDKGSFALENLLPGEYALRVWHEGFGMQERKIKVSSGEVLEVEIEFGK
ncbi:MAG: carboxypeptidase-like regulatory domain-containing protein [Nitrospirota bacterium]